MLEFISFGAAVNTPLLMETLKDGELFITSQPSGEIYEKRTNEKFSGLGLYYQDTRFLSYFRMTLNRQPAVLLSSSTRESHFTQFELTNPVLKGKGDSLIPAQTFHIRILRLVEDALLQRIRLINFSPIHQELNLTFELAADFLDIFEVRGYERPKRGELHSPVVNRNEILFSYLGQDGIWRYTRVSFFLHPTKVYVEGSLARAEFCLDLPPGRKVYLYMQIKPGTGRKPKAPPAKGRGAVDVVFRQSVKRKYVRYQQWKKECTSFSSDNLFVTEILQRTITDLYSLRTYYEGLGTVVQAGIPWYAAPFGRDSLITSWQTLLINPIIAKETLHFLAALQGKEDNPWRDEEPGKILHELRRGEMASCGEIPHTPYYGSVDATLWFIILLSETYRWTGDKSLLEKLTDNLIAAVQWYRVFGDADRDGFIEYSTRSAKGLINQGWKDSWDGVINPEGNIPKGSVTLVEVQAYYYLALRRAAEMFRALDKYQLAEEADQQAAELQQKFIKAFWLEEGSFLAFALDEDKRSIITPVSNAGHCLFTGILPDEMARKVAQRLFQSDMYSGWGIRTMSKSIKPYNPMSYHNGSVWPHDNAIIAYGLRRINMFSFLEKVVTDIFAAAMFFPYHRLPEVFCGFTRRQEGGPVKYPTACDPQAWAVGTVSFLLQIMLGIFCRDQEVYICKPMLPSWMKEITVENLKVGSGRVDLEFTREHGKTYCSVLKATKDIRTIIQN